MNEKKCNHLYPENYNAWDDKDKISGKKRGIIGRCITCDFDRNRPDEDDHAELQLYIAGYAPIIIEYGSEISMKTDKQKTLDKFCKEKGLKIDYNRIWCDICANNYGVSAWKDISQLIEHIAIDKSILAQCYDCDRNLLWKDKRGDD